MKQAPQNIKQLRDSLANSYAEMLNNKIQPRVGKDIANIAGKIINSCKVEMEYKQMMGYSEKIDFLETTDRT